MVLSRLLRALGVHAVMLHSGMARRIPGWLHVAETGLDRLRRDHEYQDGR